MAEGLFSGWRDDGSEGKACLVSMRIRAWFPCKVEYRGVCL